MAKTNTNPDTLKILKLRSENVKRVSFVEIEPDGSLVILAGENENGKSSILDSILWAMSGTKSVQGVPIKSGESDAEIEIDLGEYIVKRKFNHRGSRLEVTSKDGEKITSPQTLLDSLIGNLSFDPLAFTRMKPKDQVDFLQKLVGLDFAEIDEVRAQCYEERTEINRSIKNVESELSSIDTDSEIPDAIDVNTILTKLNVLRESKLENEIAKRKIEGLKERVALIKEELVARQSEIEHLEGTVVSVDLEEIAVLTDQIADASQVNLKRELALKSASMRESLEAKLKEHKASKSKLEKHLKTVDKKKADAIKNADWPIDGIGFNSNGVTLNKLPFEQASQAEQICTSVAMAAAASPTLRVAMIRDGSLLDDKHLELVRKTAEQYGAQVWVEYATRNSDDKVPYSIVIEDGMVKGDE